MRYFFLVFPSRSLSGEVLAIRWIGKKSFHYFFQEDRVLATFDSNECMSLAVRKFFYDTYRLGSYIFMMSKVVDLSMDCFVILPRNDS